MKLNRNGQVDAFITSDDIVMTGETIGNVLSDVVNQHEKDINNLKQNTKWLYTYGGVGSKYGGTGGSSGPGTGTSIAATVRINNTVLNAGANQQIVLNGEKEITISVSINNATPSNIYYVAINKDNNSLTSGTTPPGSNFKYQTVGSDTWYQLNKTTSITNDAAISVSIIAMGESGQQQLSYSANIIKEAYSFSLKFFDNNHNQIISAENDIWSNSVRDTGLEFGIEYNVIADNPIKFELIGDSIANMFDWDSIKNSNPQWSDSKNHFGMNSLPDYVGFINDTVKKSGKIFLPFKSEFLKNDDYFGYYTITVLLTVSETGQALQNIYKDISFTLIPQDKYFIKVTPYYSTQKFYKYTDGSYNDILKRYNDYDTMNAFYRRLQSGETLESTELSEVNALIERYYNVTEDDKDDSVQDLLQKAIKAFESTNYVYSTGAISFNIMAYFGNETQRVITLNAKLKNGVISNDNNDDNIDLGTNSQIKLRQNQKISLQVHEPGLYTFTFCTSNGDNETRIVYYMFVYNKSTKIDWYEETVLFCENDIRGQHYWRMGDAKGGMSQYKGKYYIQKYASEDGTTTAVHLDNSQIPNTINDTLIQLGIQYSANNTDISKPIIEILNNGDKTQLSDNQIIKIYQNKIAYNGEDNVQIFIPKEESYNVKENSKYHLLTIYKRFLYTTGPYDYYEVNIYIDGCLENALTSFVTDNTPFTIINLNSANYAINLMEISYFVHNDSAVDGEYGFFNKKRIADDGQIQEISYLDDIAISEYFYKYAQMNYNVGEQVPAYETVEKIIQSLKGFTEVSNGLIRVNDENTIDDIAQNGTVPVLLFEHVDKEGTLGEFVQFFTPGGSESSNITKLELAGIKYSPGGQKLTTPQMPEGLTGINGCKWYIEVQGSSTRLNFAKNLNLGITQECNGYMIVFTPNFIDYDFTKTDNSTEGKEARAAAKGSYLPETKFTLKTDQVDSTHSNNTAVGAFVNANTEPFNTNSDSSNNFRHYIKNCLLGFPVLVFIKTTLNTEPNNITSYYFLGIMNFNLGRDSYFNMGYYDINVLNNQDHIKKDLGGLKGDTFKVTYIDLNDESKTDLELRKDVIVAEIQGGNSHYDFSQSDESVLLPTNENDKAVMFGDFVPNYNYGNSENDKMIRMHLHRLVENVSLAGGYLFGRLGKHFGSYDHGYNAYIDDGDNKSIFTSANQVPNYMIQYKRNPTAVSEDKRWVIKEDGIRDAKTVQDPLYVKNLIIDYEEDIKNNAILDYISASEYYTICMAFGLVDSVMKNLNIKTWNANNVNDVKDLTARWYVAFYDMDTAFGRDNGGRYTSYFAFSDYWFTKAVGTTTKDLQQATIYADFYPAENRSFSSEQVLNIGYDVPSSYLFAVAKYAYIAFSGESDDNYFNNFKKHTPANLWARYRCGSEIQSDVLGNTGYGELQNANYFIDKYFVRNLDEIPEQLWNMNYRLKYLKRIKPIENSPVGDVYDYNTSSNGGYEASLNKSPFHGKGIYQLREWLSNRFHILDAYFNIEGGAPNGEAQFDIHNISKLNYTNEEETYDEYTNATSNIIDGVWVDKAKPKKDSKGLYDWVDSGFKMNVPLVSFENLKNNDIIITRDIFSEDHNGLKYEGGGILSLIVKAKEYSPVIIRTPQETIEKYLIENPKDEYSLTVKTTGVQNFLLGGAANFTYIENLSSLITDKKIYVESNNLEKIHIDGRNCSEYKFFTPALKELYISPIKTNDDSIKIEFSGNLTFALQNGEDNYPSLSKIDIHNTSINLTVDGEGVKEINVSGVKSNYLTLQNCLNLSTVNLNQAAIGNVIIMPAWSNNIDISNSMFSKLQIKPKDETAKERKFKLSNNENILEIELNNFTHITISGCTNLNKIILNNVENIEWLEIINCNTEGDNVSLLNIEANTTDGEQSLNTEKMFDMRIFKSLHTISFSKTRGIYRISFKGLDGESYEVKDGQLEGQVYKGINLLEAAFDSTDIITIETDGKPSNNSIDNQVLFINGNATFRNCKYVYGNNTLFVKEKCKSLSDMFAYWGSLSNDTTDTIDATKASVILGNATNVPDLCKTVYENIDNITSLSSMFLGQRKISITDDLNELTDINAILNNISLKNFKNVNDISYIYSYCSIGTINSYIFTDGIQTLGSNVSSLDINTFVHGSKINFAIDTLSPVIDKLKSFGSSNNQNKSTFTVYDGNGIMDIFEFRKIFENKQGQINQINMLEKIYGVEFTNAIDWNKAFVTNDDQFIMPNLTDIAFAFNRANKDTINKNLNEWGLNLHQKAIKVEYALNFNLSEPILYTNVINTAVTEYNGLIPINESSFNMPKYIYENDFKAIFERLSYSITTTVNNLDYQFKDIIIIKENEGDITFDCGDKVIYSGIKSMQHTFENASIRHSIDGQDEPIKLTGTSLAPFINVTNWSYAFKGVTLDCNLPLNLFNLKKVEEGKIFDYVPANYNRTITSLKGTFKDVRIASNETYFKHESYEDICKKGTKELNVDNYNNGAELDGSYHYTLEISNLVKSAGVTTKVHNPISKNKDITSGEYGKDIRTHLLLPFDIFFGCANSVDISECFAYSDFEGIMPSLLMANIREKSFTNTFTNLLVVPNRIYNEHGEDFIYNETELMSVSYLSSAFRNKYISDFNINYVHNALTNKNENHTFCHTGQNEPLMYQQHKTYLFVPRGFTDNKDLVNAFNFKMILPISIIEPKEGNIVDIHNGTYEYYFVLSDRSIGDGNTPKLVERFEDCWPGTFQEPKINYGEDRIYEFPYISNIDNPDHDQIGGPDLSNDYSNQLNPRAYHNIHYSTVLNETQIGLDNGEQVKIADNEKMANIKRIYGLTDSEALTSHITGDLLGGINKDVYEENYKYGISYRHIGMIIHNNLRQKQFAKYMGKLMLKYVFGNIFWAGDDLRQDSIYLTEQEKNNVYVFGNDSTTIKTGSNVSTYENAIDGISKYAILPKLSEDSEYAMQVNKSFIVKFNFMNTQNMNMNKDNDHWANKNLRFGATNTLGRFECED